MDFLTKIKSSQHFPPFPSPNLPISSHSESTSSFPIIAIAIIGILATAFLLLSYYIFAVNCCLNCHRIDLRRRNPPIPSTSSSSPATAKRGLDESVIRSIPLLQFKRIKSTAKEKTSSECAVCLCEFEENETVRVIPICSHFFHIDCIDIWLQNNPNCPLCRTAISNRRFTLPPEVPIGGGDDRDFVVIELGVNGIGIGTDPSGQFSQERRLNSGELSPAGKLEQGKKWRQLQKVASLGDEWIDTREKDEQFCVQPIRRSVSMDSSAERQMYLAVQAAVQQSRRGGAASPGGGDGCNGRGRRSLFSFGSGRSSVSSMGRELIFSR